MEDLKCGDVVFLKSQPHQLMTVNRLTESEAIIYAECLWFNVDGEFKADTFPILCITKQDNKIIE